MTAPRPLLGGREVRDLLQRHGLRPTKARGQNFVTDPNTVRRIVRDAGIEPGDLVVEVGPGLGSLTLALLDAGARVVAIEVDHGLAAALREVVGEAAVEIHAMDALQVRYDELLRGRQAVMVANLPYNVATPILLTALREGALRGYHLMVQREVGERWVAGVGEDAYGAVSVKVALLAEARLAGPVARQAFHPVPRVDSVTVDLRPRPGVDPAAMEPVLQLVDRGFAQRRKRLRNALSAPGPTGGGHAAVHSAARVEAMLVEAGLDAGARAEELSPPDWLRLASTA